VLTENKRVTRFVSGEEEPEKWQLTTFLVILLCYLRALTLLLFGNPRPVPAPKRPPQINITNTLAASSYGNHPILLGNRLWQSFPHNYGEFRLICLPPCGFLTFDHRDYRSIE
jgi:hypothetical protein